MRKTCTGVDYETAFIKGEQLTERFCKMKRGKQFLSYSS